MIKVMSVFGTRPEAIKMCPVILEFQKYSQIKSVVCLTGQHKEMLKQVIDIFNISVDYNLEIMKDSQTLSSITTDILLGMKDILAVEKPDLVLVHGDTTTSFAVALAAYYEQIPVGHVEAGLRTYNKYAPFPEEINRTLTGHIADIHFAPTYMNKEALNKENVYENVYVTGNTVIDALNATIKEGYKYKSEELQSVISHIVQYRDKKIILLTAHRRENLGQPLVNICEATLDIVNHYTDIEIIYPVHMNPAVRKTVSSILGNHDRIHLIEPIDVEDMHNLINASYLIMTDSGGLQEEAPSCGKPVVVLRCETERQEAIEAGTVVLAGTEKNDICENVMTLIEDVNKYTLMSKAINPYGDGNASKRIVEAIMDYFEVR